jgi:hypothetical protein
LVKQKEHPTCQKKTENEKKKRDVMQSVTADGRKLTPFVILK